MGTPGLWVKETETFWIRDIWGMKIERTRKVRENIKGQTFIFLPTYTLTPV